MKKPIEKDAEGSAEVDDEDTPITMIDNIRLKVFEFIRESSRMCVSLPGCAGIQEEFAI